jgi:hypothetical protein
MAGSFEFTTESIEIDGNFDCKTVKKIQKLIWICLADVQENHLPDSFLGILCFSSLTSKSESSFVSSNKVINGESGFKARTKNKKIGLRVVEMGKANQTNNLRHFS